MNETELAMKMLQYGELRSTLDALEAQIKTAVLERGKTQTVGNVRASYSTGRKTYDYQEAADGHPMVSNATVELFTTLIPETQRVDWHRICDHAGIEDIPFTQSEPSVTVKLVE